MARRYNRAQRKSMTQRELSARLAEKGCALSRLAIGRIENGEREISDIELIHIADVLGMDVGYLLCGSQTVQDIVQEFADDRSGE